MTLKTQAEYPHAYHEFIAKDPDGIPRCFGYGPNEDEARSECWKEICDYVEFRPWAGPVDKWTVEKTN
jgi:hypothetical protein